ncbi:MAG: hypothetical protein EOP24_40360 [Hyphomicrobiales bacterium]|nr:MAG: hypothetical protein EOP24_40360 [Hyphomicrobiales bacterium]
MINASTPPSAVFTSVVGAANTSPPICGGRSARAPGCATRRWQTCPRPDQILADADAGYCSADNLDRAAEFADEHDTEFYVATGRRRRDDPPPIAPRRRIPQSANGKQRMAGKLATRKGRNAYARRKAIVEPVFGQMSTCRTPNTCCSADSTRPAANGCCSPPVTTSASSTA